MNKHCVHRRGMVGRAPPFQRGEPDSIPGGVTFLLLILGLGVYPSSVRSFVVSGGGPDILLTTKSGRPALVLFASDLVLNLWLLYSCRAHGLWSVSSGEL